MKNGKLSWLLNPPVRAVILVSAAILVSEFLIMVLIESLHTTPMMDVPQKRIAFEFLDPILLIAIIFPVLYFLVFRPLSRQQAELENARKKINEAFQEWMAALDAVNDPIFLHDKDFRILRCNKAYQQCAGIPFHEIIGQLYYEVFPKNHEPLPSCQRAMEKAEEELAVGGAFYRSRAFSIKDEQGVYLYSVHTLEDITERKRAEAQLTEQLEELRGWHDVTLGREMRVLELKHEVDELLRQAGQPPRYPGAESDDSQEK